jgi:hypothetical protein
VEPINFGIGHQAPQSKVLTSFLKKVLDIALSPVHPHLSSMLHSMTTTLQHPLTMSTPLSLELLLYQNLLHHVLVSLTPPCTWNLRRLSCSTPHPPCTMIPLPTGAPAAPHHSARLAVLGTGAPMTALLSMLPDSQIPHSYWEAMTRPDLWLPPMETE